MKNILGALLVTWLSASAANEVPLTQVNKPVTCGPIGIILKTLGESDIAEVPVWVGTDARERSHYSVFMNIKTGAFTILQFTPEFGCVLGVGHHSKTIDQSTKTEHRK